MPNSTQTLRRKISDTWDIKLYDDETGSITALVNTMGVIDHDDDRILSGAFDESLGRLSKESVAVLWGHDSKEVVGKVLDGYEIGLGEKSVLYLEMLFNLKTQRGRDAYEDVKFGAINEWSVGFNVSPEDISVTREGAKSITDIARVQLVEVSAVLRGSSPGTGTISVKTETEKRALPAHDTATTEESWDAGIVVSSMPNEDEALYKQMYAWASSAEDVNLEAKSSYKFPHHEYSTGAVRDANMRACISIIAILNGGMGGADIPDDDRQGVWNHAAAHLRDGDREPPTLKEKSELFPGSDEYTTIEEARTRAQALGCDGVHQMTRDGETYYMPCRNHSIYESIATETPSGNVYSADLEATKEHIKEVKVAPAEAAATNLLRVRLKWLFSKLGEN